MAELTQERPGQTTGQQDGGGGGPAEQMQEKAQQAVGQAQEKVQEAAGQARSRVSEQVDQRTTDAGGQVKMSAQDMRSVAEHLRTQGKQRPAELAEQAAQRAERLGGYLEEADADRILRDIEDFGRRQPLALMLGGLALGFAASRFLKASSEQRFQQRSFAPAPQAAQIGSQQTTAYANGGGGTS